MKQKNNQATHYSIGTQLQWIGPLLVLAGALIYNSVALRSYSGWLVSIGGVAYVIGILLELARIGSKTTSRMRRLNRLSLLGNLIYIVAGGFMLQGSSSWLALFIVGTIFYIYSIFAKDRIIRKEKKEL